MGPPAHSVIVPPVSECTIGTDILSNRHNPHFGREVEQPKLKAAQGFRHYKEGVVVSDRGTQDRLALNFALRRGDPSGKHGGKEKEN